MAENTENKNTIRLRSCKMGKVKTKDEEEGEAEVHTSFIYLSFVQFEQFYN